MDVIFGGAYQGKKEYAMKQYSLKKEDIFYCVGDELDFTKKAICGLHIFIYETLKAQKDPIQYIKQNVSLLKDKIIMCDDISCGVVPMSALERKWRESNGGCLKLLCGEAESVTRVFCGLPQIIKS